MESLLGTAYTNGERHSLGHGEGPLAIVVRTRYNPEDGWVVEDNSEGAGIDAEWHRHATSWNEHEAIGIMWCRMFELMS